MLIFSLTMTSIRISSLSLRNRYSIIQTKTEDEAKAVLDELNKGGDFAALAKKNLPISSLPVKAAIWDGWKIQPPRMS